MDTGKVVGVIIPPPDIRSVVDKTAQFVARNGKSFEARIQGSAEGKSTKFNFMKQYDPYHAYYEQKIREFEEGPAKTEAPITTTKEDDEEPEGESMAEETKASDQTSATQVTAQKPLLAVSTSVKASIVNPIARVVADFSASLRAEDGTDQNTAATSVRPLFFSNASNETLINAKISAVDADIIKLTAQYTATNGKDFLKGVILKEQRNSQFDFLRPTHMLFTYFTALVDSYSAILHPQKELTDFLLDHSVPEEEARQKILADGVRRWEYNRFLEEKKKRDTGEEDAERLAFQAIDWGDFTVVETVHFPLDEVFDHSAQEAEQAAMEESKSSYPPPSSYPSSSSSSSNSSSSNSSSSHFPSSSGPSGAPGLSSATPMMPPPPPPPRSSNMMEMDDDDDDAINVVSDYNPRIAGGQAGSKGPLMMMDPVSGKLIPASDMTEHMRVQLLDPKWREEQKRFQDKQKETGFAEGSSIADSLRTFAKKRGDIFGQSVAATSENSAQAIARESEILESKVKATPQWDGTYGSIDVHKEMYRAAPAASSYATQQPPTKTMAGPSLPTFQQIYREPMQKRTAPAPTSAPAPAPAPAPMAAFTGPFVPLPASQNGSGSAPAPASYTVPAPPPLARPRAPLTTFQPPSGIMPPPFSNGGAPPPTPALPPPSSTSSSISNMWSSLAPTAPSTVPSSGSTYLPPISLAPPPVTTPYAVPYVAPSTAPIPYTVPSAPPSRMMEGLQPEPKRQKVDLPPPSAPPQTLVSEEEFAAMHPNPVTINIFVPYDESSPFNLKGQTLSLQISVATVVKDIKDLIGTTYLAGLAAGKFQLKSASGFLKDAQTLAVMNLGPGASLELSLKSRGGKK